MKIKINEKHDLNVADMVITLANQFAQPVTNLGLQKQLYYLNIISWLKRKQPLITASFEKWDYGATLPNVYNEYRKFGASKISQPIQHWCLRDPSKREFSPNNIKKYSFSPDQISLADQQFIQKVLPELLVFQPFTLVAYSQKEPQWQQRHRQQFYAEKYDLKQSINYYKKHQFWQQKGK